LNVVTVLVPPLRERTEDIPELAEYLLRRAAARLKLPVPKIAPEVYRMLAAREWPGNVRELEHTLERALILSRGGPIVSEHIEPHAGGAPDESREPLEAEDGLHAAVRSLERRLIRRALAQAGGNRSRAAELLKINRRLLYDKLRDLGIE
jgi:DNA-binding NtrC family response regulator